MKLKFIKARGTYAAGDVADVEDAEAMQAVTAKDAMDFDTWQTIETMRVEKKGAQERRVREAVLRAKDRGAVPPKDEAMQASWLDRLNKGGDVDLIVELIDQRPGDDRNRNLTQRLIARDAHDGSPLDNGNGMGGRVIYERNRLELVRPDPRDVGAAYIKAREPMENLIRGGGKEGVKKAIELSIETGAMLKANILPILANGGDIMLKDLIRGADTTDPNSQVGTLATGLILMRNLGYLKNKLGWMPYISTDLRNEPALYGQPIFTRYITVPNVLTYVPGVGYTSDATTIANAGLNVGGANYASGEAPTQTSGTRTPSAPSTTDVTVKMNRHRAVEIVFPTTTLGSTVRNLFSEQQGAQFYGLAEQVNKDFLLTAFAATWSGIIGNSAALGGQAFALPGMVKLKTLFTANKTPDFGRFILLHSFYHDQILTDGNLVTAKAITALVNKDMTAFESGSLPILYGITVLESQLAAASNSTTLVTPTDPTQIQTQAPFAVGFAGNMTSMLFVARVPQDYTTVFKDIPATAAIEILTEPDSGLSILFTKYVDHALAQVSARCALMYGFAQGFPLQGFILTP